MTEISRMTKEQLIEHINKCADEKNNLIRNFEEEQRNREIVNKRRMTRLTNELIGILPNTDKFLPYDMTYFRNERMSIGNFAIAKKDVMKFDKYQLGVQIFNLPDEFKVNKFRCVLLAIFDKKHNLISYGLLNNRFGEVRTFHSHPYSVCIGANNTALEIVDFNNPETILKGFEEVKDTLETINPESLLTTSLHELPRVLRNTLTFVKKKLNEYNERNEENNNDER